MAQRLKTCVGWLLALLIALFGGHAMAESIEEVLALDKEADAESLLGRLRDDLEDARSLGLKSRHVMRAIEKGWWTLSSQLIDLAVAEGIRVENDLNLATISINRKLTQLKRQVHAAKPDQKIAPAFQWAQSADSVYIEIKFAHKLDAPAALGVKKDVLDIAQRRVDFVASKDHKKFELSIALENDIVPEESTFSMASVGRCTLVLKKKEKVVWQNLIPDSETRPQNMHIWWEIKEKYQKELKDLDKNEPKRKRKRKKKQVPAARTLLAEKKKVDQETDAKLKELIAEAKNQKKAIDDESNERKKKIDDDKKAALENEATERRKKLEEEYQPQIKDQEAERDAKAAAAAESVATEGEKEDSPATEVNGKTEL